MSSSERDAALRIAHDTDQLVADSDVGVFVLTGSYSIDALTGDSVTHNDVDSNIFYRVGTPDVVERTAELLEAQFPIAEAQPVETSNRLVYKVGESKELLEIGFMPFSSVEDDWTLVLPGHNRAGEDIRVPLVRRSLKDLEGKEYEFTVKSLEYAIATWAIRISGFVDGQKRPVRQTDIDHFAYLLAQPRQDASVLDAMVHHPQMLSTDPALVFDAAMNIVDKAVRR